jgi:hypothetical protein
MIVTARCMSTAESQEAAEKAEREEASCKLAAACGIARLSHVVLGLDNLPQEITDMIDPEVRPACCRTPHSYHAFYPGTTETACRKHDLDSPLYLFTYTCMYVHMCVCVYIYIYICTKNEMII